MSTQRPRVLVTRSQQQASALADRLRDLGMEPVVIPAIETVEPASFSALDAALQQLPTFHWVLFTSANAVEAFGRRLRTLGGNALPQRIAVIGPATSRALEAMGLRAELMPSTAVAESLAEALLPHARQPDGSPTRFLLVRAEEAREHLPETLHAAGAEVTIAPAYRTVLPSGSVERIRELFRAPEAGSPPQGAGASPMAAVTFTSSSTARHLFALLRSAGCSLPETVMRASIGPITSATLCELGFPPHVEAPEATVESLAISLARHLRGMNSNQEHS